jgi:hypothetical protein
VTLPLQYHTHPQRATEVSRGNLEESQPWQLIVVRRDLRVMVDWVSPCASALNDDRTKNFKMCFSRYLRIMTRLLGLHKTICPTTILPRVCNHCNGNIFTWPLRSNSRGIHTQTRTLMQGIYVVRSCDRLITIKLLDFVHRPDFYKQKTQRFGNWICFRLQARGEGYLFYRKTKSLPFHRRRHRLWKGKLLVFL